MSLWDRRLLIVTGKGGVGKTVASLALALAAARAGRRACVVELYGQARIPAIAGLPGRRYTPQQVAPGVDTISLTPMEALDDFGQRKLKLNALVKLFLRNRVMSAFIDAVPGLHDLLQLGKVENLLLEPLPRDPRYDLVVLDAPSTGHGLTLLAAARAMRELARVGPFHDLAAIIERLLSDAERTGLVVVTLPEELPVSETGELLRDLGPDRQLLAGLLVNRLRPAALPAQPPWPEVRGAFAGSGSPDVQALTTLADDAWAAQQAQARALALIEGLLAELPGPPVPLMRLPYRPAGVLTHEDAEALAGALHRRVGVAS